MWYGLSLSSRHDVEQRTTVNEMLRATQRHLIWVAGGGYLAWFFLGSDVLPPPLILRLLPVTLIVALACALALWLLPRWFLLAQALWYAGLAVALVLAMRASQQPGVALAFALLPMMVAVTSGWPFALLAEGVVIAVLMWIAHTPSMPVLTYGWRMAIILGGLLGSAFGWVSTRALLATTSLSVASCDRALEKVEEGREQALELKQVQEDLLHANAELARLSDRLKAMHRVAEEARQAKAEFVANVSHELRTPLNMIIGFTDVIAQAPDVYGGQLSSALLADIATIRRNSQHLAQLVNDVLDLSQVEAGRMALSRATTSAEDLVASAQEVVRPLFQTKGLHLRSVLASDLPPLFCDRTRVRQVLINLLSNAGRFTEQGGVDIAVSRQDDTVVFSVSDTGPGITPEDQQRIFEPFQQLDSSIRRRHTGSGLGLSISKHLVEMHGGKMWLESRPGAGTTISFSIPSEAHVLVGPLGEEAMRWFSPYSDYEYRQRTRRSKAPVPTLVPRYVLLDSGEMLQRLFTRYVDGAQTVVVRNVEEAKQEVGRSPAQALVVNAPPSGPAALAPDQLVGLPFDTPVAFCWVPGGDEAARELNVRRYLVKPITSEALLAALADLKAPIESVLLVDDDREVLRLFSRMLAASERGYRVMWATNGPRALTLMKERRPDVVLLDLIMPGMDGFQVLQAKSQNLATRDIPVVVISSRDPSGEPIMSEQLIVTRGGGLSARDLLACIQTISAALALSPSAQPVGPALPGMHPG